MISREHTTIFVKAKRDRYACFIKDHSLNGTYVNDFRVMILIADNDFLLILRS